MEYRYICREDSEGGTQRLTRMVDGALDMDRRSGIGMETLAF